MNKFLKVLVIMLCAVALVAGSVAATVAYLTMKTDTVQNTFTVGDINIELSQVNPLDGSKIIPGLKFDVDPKVTVKAGSESCWLFIKIDKPSYFDTFLTYAVADGWTALEGVSGVYYREVEATDTKVVIDVIADGKVTAKSECTKAQYNDIISNKDNAYSEAFNLQFTAYAVQKVGFETPAAAWAQFSTVTETETETETRE